MVAQAWLVAFPDRSEPFLEARKGMAGLRRDERLEACKGFAEGVQVDAGSSGDEVGRARGASVPVQKPVQRTGIIDLGSQRCGCPFRNSSMKSMQSPLPP